MANVYSQKIAVCNKGRARYRDELAEMFSIADVFAADACSLLADYGIDAYMNFFEDWGHGNVNKHFVQSNRHIRRLQKIHNFNARIISGIDYHQTIMNTLKSLH